MSTADSRLVNPYCHGMNREMAASLRDTRRQGEQLGHRLDLLLRRRYGPRSERGAIDRQMIR